MELTLIDMLLGDPIRLGGERFLDLGCGIGLASVYASNHFTQVEGIDIDEIGVSFKIDRPAPLVGSELVGLLGIGNVALHVCDTLKYLEQRSNAFDMILTVFVLEHIEKIDVICELIARALRPKGRAVHIIPNTHDAANQLLIQNLQPVADNERNSIAKGRGVRKMGNWYAPITHSEFIDDYRQQFDINSLERFIFPMLSSGLSVKRISPMREHSYGVLAEKTEVAT